MARLGDASPKKCAKKTDTSTLLRAQLVHELSGKLHYPRSAAAVTFVGVGVDSGHDEHAHVGDALLPRT